MNTQELQRLCDAATPGARKVNISGDGALFISRESDGMYLFEVGVPEDDTAEADAKFAAACDPNAISELLAELAELQRFAEQTCFKLNLEHQTVEALRAELAAVTAERDRLREQVPQWMPCSEVTPESGLVIPATVFHEGYALCFRAIPDLPAPPKDQDHE